LFTERPTRDLDAANRALARLRAEFGDESVVCAKLTDGHLPEARFTWEPLSRVKLPACPEHGRREPKSDAVKTLVRRVAAKPRRLAGGPYHSHEDGWLILGPKHGTIDKLTGPMSSPVAGGTARSSANTTSPKPPRRSSLALLRSGKTKMVWQGTMNKDRSNRSRSSNCSNVGRES